jgi:thioredoxin-related protein
LLLSLCSFAQASEPSIDNNFPVIPFAADFHSDMLDQQNSKRVILLYVSAPHCAFCKKLEKEIIYPLLKSGEYKNKIILRKINWRGNDDILNFNGESLKPSQLLEQYQIRITPTLLFLGANGKELHKRLLGYRGGEFYWYYFDAAIGKSNLRLDAG